MNIILYTLGVIRIVFLGTYQKLSRGYWGHKQLIGVIQKKKTLGTHLMMYHEYFTLLGGRGGCKKICRKFWQNNSKPFPLGDNVSLEFMTAT